MSAPLVTAEKLGRRFSSGGFLRRRPGVQAVVDLNLSIAPGDIVGLVGESGSGKSTIGRLLLGLIPASAGRVCFDGDDLARASSAQRRRLRKKMQLVFQDPYSSLDPRRTVGRQIADGIVIHGLLPSRQIPARVDALLRQVGLDPSAAGRYPHEFSGGQRQRVALARALATEPVFLVADEPVSALDVSVQAQVLKLFADLRQSLGLAILFISHDLGAVRHLCDRVVVLYLGRVMEEGPVEAVFSRPAHPYTAALMSAAPSLDVARRRHRIVLQGDPPSPLDPPSGCVFRTRCPFAIAACATEAPQLTPVGGSMHRAACIRVGEDTTHRIDDELHRLAFRNNQS
ncbi:ABC transporter ATP-binding protein [Methylocapsa sp. S129]|uniref:ABC transporter ATP-binding protein n=1 Tax=Methylocapsa sp. S129 TaxID=1641869 RepID=UPI00131C61E0|nr:oligopeptide/dipeptide ABC transporter ATP-binding protein [Methylocapsa sp. S129]